MYPASTNPSGVRAGGNGEPRIVAVCLIPEPLAVLQGYGQRSQGLEEALNKLQAAFALRFTGAYYVSVQRGLVPVCDDYQPGDKCWTDLTTDARFRFIDQLRLQLAEELADGRKCLCLLGSILAQAMRRLPYQYLNPLSSMSRAQRRDWLTKAVAESNDMLIHRLFGKPIIVGKSVKELAAGIGHSVN